MRFDSCRQCIRRRIACDAAEPECQKCRRKGIDCSGLRKVYHFVECNAASRGGSTARPGSSAIVECEKQNDKVSDRVAGPNHSIAFSGTEILCGPKESEGSCTGTHASLRGVTTKRHRYENPVRDYDWTLVETICLQPLEPRLRMLFHHFSSTISPAMVVIDHEWNGYRRIILPFATTDPLVQRAVSVVSGLHLGKKVPGLLAAAERGRSAIIQRLCNDVSQGHLGKVLNISTWTTIILLLVGETVTGDQGFVYLFPMLSSFMNAFSNSSHLQSEVTDFLWQQTQMFNFFTPPFLDPSSGTTALQQIEQYLDFLATPTSSTEVFAALGTIRRSIHLARDLYLRETCRELPAAARWQAVENIKQLVDEFGQNMPGMHALVWTYFIAAAASSDRVQREFFLDRLHQIYDKTGMRNVLTAIDLLERTVWCLPEGQNWTSSGKILRQVLIM